MEQLDQIMEEVDLTKMVNLLEAQINNGDYTAMDLAAAFLYQALGKGGSGPRPARTDFSFADTGAAEEGMVRLFVNIGQKTACAARGYSGRGGRGVRYAGRPGGSHRYVRQLYLCGGSA